MTQVHGECDPRFAGVRAAFERQLDGEELGASIAVDLAGQTVVDVWGGYRDEARTTPWTSDTIVNVWSTTKTVTCLAALMLVERGQLDVSAPVARYWPEFAAGGKDRVQLRHLLSHTSGVSGWDGPFTLEEMYDWDASTARLAAQAPWWEPGTASGYHAQNYGHLLGEVIRRVSGKSLKQFVAEEIAGPLHADFQIGAKESDWGRIADIVPPPPAGEFAGLDPLSPAMRTFTGPAANAASANTAGWRLADMGGINGYGNARSVMQLLRAVSLGGQAGGVRLLSPKTISLIFEEQANGYDLVLGIPLRWGTGFALPTPETLPYLPQDGRVCFWGGWGGSMIVMDLERQLTISYVMNRMAPGIIGSDRSEVYIRAIYQALGVPLLGERVEAGHG